jgi:Tol biopolymer transport system component
MSPHSIDLSVDGSMIVSKTSFRANVWAIDVTSSDPESTLHQVTFGDHQIEGLDISHDGRWMAFDSGLHGDHDVFVHNLASGTANRVTLDEEHEFWPQWSPDGAYLVYYSLGTKSRILRIMRSDGTDQRSLTDGSFDVQTLDWSPDGRQLLVYSDRNGISGFYLLTGWEDEAEPTWTKLSDVESLPGPQGDFSPEGDVVAVTGAGGLYVIASDGSVHRKLAPDEFDLQDVRGPRWSYDGDTLFFLARDHQSAGIWRYAIESNECRLVMRFANEAAGGRRQETALHGSTFYFTQRELTADLWLMRQ